MITIYAKDLESAQKLANKHRIPAGLWKFLCSEGEFKGQEFEGIVINELQSDKTIEFLMTQAKKEQNNCKTVHYTAITPEDVIRIQEVASEALGLLKQRLNQEQGD